MKHADIQKLHEAGLITEEQRQKIIAHFGFREEGSPFFGIVTFIGAVLALTGAVLLISANWDEIPRGAKIAAGLALMFGTHAGGWWLCEVRRDYRKTGEALHFIGAGLFLANIALVGQIYHLVSRPPNAVLLWLVGIAPLPWLLRSKAQLVLVLAALGVWFGLEINERGSLIYFGENETQIVLYALLGLIYLGFGYVLRRTRYAELAAVAEQLGLVMTLMFVYPLTWGIWEGVRDWQLSVCHWLFPAMSVVAIGLAFGGVCALKNLDRQWRWTWALALAGLVALLAGQLYFGSGSSFGAGGQRVGTPYHWIASVGLFVFAMLQIRVGIEERSRFMVNLAVAFIGLDIFATYLSLIDSMARTGSMFLISGVFLIAFSVFLEKKRRKLMQQIKTAKTSLEAV